MIEWISRNKKAIIRTAFLIPIFSVAVISISHVVSWYDIANPISWAIYLSIAVEIAAMSAIAASSVKVKGFSVWFVFVIVTLIQFIGNIFYSYSEIQVESKSFKDWSELIAPILEAMGSDMSDTLAQRRWLALLEGGLLPLISLTCLHFFIKYGEIDETDSVDSPREEVSALEAELTVPQPDEPTEAAPLKEETVEEINIPEAKGEPKVEEAAPTPKRPLPLSHKMQKIINRR